jgi:lipopolysaccharide export system protein LptA
MIQIFNKLKAIIGIFIALSSLTFNTYALPSDHEQEIVISSDQASLNKLQGELIYSGNVELVQGTLIIQADKVTLIRSSDGTQQLIAKGKPARYEQVLSDTEDKTHAYGETIIYNVIDNELTLLKNAGLKKQGNVFAGEKIVYLIKEQRVKADSTQQDRVRMVIQPKSDKEP